MRSAALNSEARYLYPGMIFAEPGDFGVTTVLGSCVSVCLWDPAAGVGIVDRPHVRVWAALSFAFGGMLTFAGAVLLATGERDAGTLLILAMGLGILGQLGDFTGSMVKRSAQVNDSGTLIPGHGGMLDRLDSFFFSAPFLHYALLYLLKEIP